MWNTMDVSNTEILIERQLREARDEADHRALADSVRPRAERPRRGFRIAVPERLSAWRHVAPWLAE